MTVYRSTYYTETGSTVPPKQVAPTGTPVCHNPDCTNPLPPDSMSEWFCSDKCQSKWAQQGTHRPDDVLGPPRAALDERDAIPYTPSDGHAPDTPSDRLPPRRTT